MPDSPPQETGPRQLIPLVDNPREDLDVELKSWLDLRQDDHKANVAQALLALANHGGGFLLFGFEERAGSWVPQTTRPVSLEDYCQDTISSIVHAYADPPFQCAVHLVPRTQDGSEHPVVVVPGGHRVPVRAKRDGPNNRHVRLNTYYIRRPGPCSESPQSAHEWSALINRCLRASRDELLDTIRVLIGTPVSLGGEPNESSDPAPGLRAWTDASLARWQELVRHDLSDDNPPRFTHGHWYASYLVTPVRADLSAEEFLQTLTTIRGYETGWPVFLVGHSRLPHPYPFEGLVESWFGPVMSSTDAALSDFWRASRSGRAFLLRAHQEDGNPQQAPPGTLFDFVLPIWRAGEVLLHAARMAHAIGVDDPIVGIEMGWTGLSGRTMGSLSPETYVRPGRVCRQDEVVTSLATPSSRIEDALPELVHKLLSPLYECFDFFTLSSELVNDQIGQMRRNAT